MSAHPDSLQAADATCGVADGDAFCREKGANVRLAVAFAVGTNEAVAVIEENKAEDAPHIVLNIRIVEVHFPAPARRRKTAEHEQSGIGRGEGRQRVGFGFFCHGFVREIATFPFHI